MHTIPGMSNGRGHFRTLFPESPQPRPAAALKPA